MRSFWKRGEAGYPDREYTEKGAKLVADRAEVFRIADIVVQVLCYGSNDVNGKADLPLMRSAQVIVGFLQPMGKREEFEELANTGVTSFAVELMPRTTRAQSMDALSSMGICGYQAVVMAADTLSRLNQNFSRFRSNTDGFWTPQITTKYFPFQ